MKRRGFLGSMIAAAFAPASVMAGPIAAPVAAAMKLGRGMTTSIFHVDESPWQGPATYSVAYNLQAARQDEFGETFFPTVVITS